MSKKKRVLILCTGNSARSQMAEGLLRHFGGDKFEVESAGVISSFVRPQAVKTMSEIGIDISSHRLKSLDEFLDEPFDYVLTVCDNAKESCPGFRGGLKGFTGVSTTRLKPKEARKKNSPFSAASATRSTTG
jgi:arsenate reductase